MSNKVITMQQVRSVIQYLEKGYSLRAITRQMGLSRKTVTVYAQRLQQSSYDYAALRSMDDASLTAIVYDTSCQEQQHPQDARLTDFISRIDYFIQELKRTGVTRQLLW